MKFRIVLEELAREQNGKVAFAKLNVDENGLTAAKYRAMSIPTVIVFQDGKAVDQMVGAMPKAALEQRLSGHLQPGHA